MATSQFEPAEQAAPAREPGHAEALGQLERILAHPLFQSSQRLSRFLRFAVENALAGRAGQLKEFVIGVLPGRRSDRSDQD
jgi:hypothetical protein